MHDIVLQSSSQFKTNFILHCIYKRTAAFQTILWKAEEIQAEERTGYKMKSEIRE